MFCLTYSSRRQANACRPGRLSSRRACRRPAAAARGAGRAGQAQQGKQIPHSPRGAANSSPLHFRYSPRGATNSFHLLHFPRSPQRSCHFSSFPSPSPYTMGIVLESKDESIEVSQSPAKTLSVCIPLTPILSMYPSSHWYEDNSSHLVSTSPLPQFISLIEDADAAARSRR